jgi:hypothetical protein
MTHLLAYDLEQKGYQVKLFRNDFRYGNHFYLGVSGNGLEESLIVDPTYRQFFRADVDALRNYQFNSNLFVGQPPFFVGTRDELVRLADDFVRTMPQGGAKAAPYQEGTVFWKERTAVDVTDQLHRMRPKMLEFIRRRLPAS